MILQRSVQKSSLTQMPTTTSPKANRISFLLLPLYPSPPSPSSLPPRFSSLSFSKQLCLRTHEKKESAADCTAHSISSLFLSPFCRFLSPRLFSSPLFLSLRDLASKNSMPHVATVVGAAAVAFSSSLPHAQHAQIGKKKVFQKKRKISPPLLLFRQFGQ